MMKHLAATLAFLLATPALAGTGEIWFTPRAGNQQWFVHGRHDMLASAYQISVPPALAQHVLEVESVGPFVWWDWLDWNVYEPGHPCAGWGWLTGGYTPGGDFQFYEGPLAIVTFDEPVVFVPAPHCAHPDDSAAFWFRGDVPAMPMPGSWWLTTAGDLTGNGAVSVADLLAALAGWGVYNVGDVLDILAGWG